MRIHYTFAKNFLWLHLVTISLIITNISVINGQYGRVEIIMVDGVSLAGNLLNDPTAREVSVYLPHAYDQNPSQHFPVLYMLHGYTWNNRGFMSYVKSACDYHFNQVNTEPFIVVIPNANNAYEGSFYTNSFVTGNWEDYVVQDLVNYIDANYRTLTNRENRGISGHSMGGYGALKLAMKHPDKFNAVYGLSSGCLVFEDVQMSTMFNYLIQAANATTFSGPWQVRVMIAEGAAFSPCVNPHPFYCDLPVDANGTVIDSVWQKWLEHDPSLMIATLRENLMQLKIKFDCGTQDNALIMANRHFSDSLNSHGIPHEFLEFTGDHTNKLQERIRNFALPFFSNVLVDVESDDPEMPSNFSIFQNYPNPFNPVTTIKYSIPEISQVIIVVTDVLGNEIEILVNEEKSPGTYELTWHAENLPSGVYFYRLQVYPTPGGAGDFVETKKMLLLK